METQLDSYGRLCAIFYDAEKPEPPEAELARYAQLLRTCTGPVLEPMAGSGRFLLPLLKQGLDVWGFDAAPRMVEQARARLQAAQQQPARVLLADFDTFASKQAAPVPSQFAGSFIPAGSLGLLGPKQVQHALNLHAQWLAPGGRLWFDLFVPDLQGAGQLSRSARVASVSKSHALGLVVESRISQDGCQQNLICHYTELINGSITATESEPMVIHRYTSEQVKHMAESAGLTCLNVQPQAFGDIRSLYELQKM